MGRWRRTVSTCNDSNRAAESLPAGVFTAVGLKGQYDAGLPVAPANKAVTVTSVGGGTSYCISVEGKTGTFWKKAGPGADIVSGSAGC